MLTTAELTHEYAIRNLIQIQHNAVYEILVNKPEY